MCPAQSSWIDVRNSLRAAAAALPVFETGDFVYNRWPYLPWSGGLDFPVIGKDSSVGARYRQTLSGLIEANYTVSDLVGALSDPQPPVRTLAMALLFQKEDPKLLTEISFLINDNAQTFPCLAPVDNIPAEMPTRPQTVGEIAQAMIRMYTNAAGLEDWNSYQRTHTGRPYYLSWFEVRLLRATGSVTPFRADRRPLVIRVRHDLDQLPVLDRDMYLLWLSRVDPDWPLAAESELVSAARRLGHQQLLQIVDGRPPGTDPDVLQTHRPWRYRAVVSFILSHADQLLMRADEPFLAAIEQGQRDRISRGGADGSQDAMVADDYARARALLFRSGVR
jgi:hypothetical protein